MALRCNTIRSKLQTFAGSILAAGGSRLAKLGRRLKNKGYALQARAVEGKEATAPEDLHDRSALTEGPSQYFSCTTPYERRIFRCEVARDVFSEKLAHAEKADSRSHADLWVTPESIWALKERGAKEVRAFVDGSAEEGVPWYSWAVCYDVGKNGLRYADFVIDIDNSACQPYSAEFAAALVAVRLAREAG